MKQKLINIIKEELSGSMVSPNGLYQLDSKRLQILHNKIWFTEEFINSNLLITNSPSFNVGEENYKVKTWTLTERESIEFSGTFYLYQINTIDFKSFDIRGYNIPGPNLNNYQFNFEGLTEEQIGAIKKRIDRTESKTETQKIDLINYSIEQYRRENAAIDSIVKGNIRFEKYISEKLSDKENNSYTDLVKEINVIEKTLNNCDSLDDEQVIELRDRIKSFESKLKDKIKPKTITISSAVHNKIKKHCQDFGFKIGDWVEETLLEKIAINAYEVDKRTHEEWVEDEKQKLLEKYKEYKKTNKLIKLDKLVLLPRFKFMGYSQLDFKPVYDYTGTEKQFSEDCENIKTKMTLINRDIYVSKYLPEFSTTEVEGFDGVVDENETNGEFMDLIKKMFKK